ncbi:GNAT family N-acetyltransferase [Deinococcus lacus]|uniref:GNAT family N-acetyltransferase n=1 Tax=Deinococcus lacus TaxID=392561 RepID=A0ABW1YGG9_9DEIO
MAAQQASRAELRRFMVWAQAEPDLETVQRNLETAAEQFSSGEVLRYHIWHGGEFVGSTGFHALDWQVPKGEIGYWIATPHAGHGYAREAAAALTELGLRPVANGGLGLRRIEIRCDASNERSQRIPPQLGYTLDARLVNFAVAADDPSQLRDTLLFSRTV